MLEQAEARRAQIRLPATTTRAAIVARRAASDVPAAGAWSSRVALAPTATAGATPSMMCTAASAATAAGAERTSSTMPRQVARRALTTQPYAGGYGASRRIPHTGACTVTLPPSGPRFVQTVAEFTPNW